MGMMARRGVQGMSESAEQPTSAIKDALPARMPCPQGCPTRCSVDESDVGVSDVPEQGAGGTRGTESEKIRKIVGTLLALTWPVTIRASCAGVATPGGLWPPWPLT